MIGIGAVVGIALAGAGSRREPAASHDPVAIVAGTARADASASPTPSPDPTPGRVFRPRVRLEPPRLADDGSGGRTLTVRGVLTRGTGPIQVVVMDGSAELAVASTSIGPLSTPTMARRNQPFEVNIDVPDGVDPAGLRVRVVVHSWDGWPLETDVAFVEPGVD